jgi:hypothetical protein
MRVCLLVCFGLFWFVLVCFGFVLVCFAFAVLAVFRQVPSAKCRGCESENAQVPAGCRSVGV